MVWGYEKDDISKIIMVSNQSRTRNNAFKLDKVRLKNK